MLPCTLLAAVFHFKIICFCLFWSHFNGSIGFMSILSFLSISVVLYWFIYVSLSLLYCCFVFVFPLYSIKVYIFCLCFSVEYCKAVVCVWYLHQITFCFALWHLISVDKKKLSRTYPLDCAQGPDNKKILHETNTGIQYTCT